MPQPGSTCSRELDCPDFSSLLFLTNGVTSDYHATTAEIRHNVSRGAIKEFDDTIATLQQETASYRAGISMTRPFPVNLTNVRPDSVPFALLKWSPGHGLPSPAITFGAILKLKRPKSFVSLELHSCGQPSGAADSSCSACHDRLICSNRLLYRHPGSTGKPGAGCEPDPARHRRIQGPH